MKKKKILLKLVIIGTIGSTLFLINNVHAIDETKSSITNAKEEKILKTYNDKSTKNINKIKEIDGIYKGNGIILVGKTNVKIISKYLPIINEGDKITLKIKGDINSFNIKDLIVNDVSLYNKVDNIITQGWKSKYQGYGIFTLNGLLKDGFLTINDNGKERKIRIESKFNEKYDNQNVIIQVKGTLKKFKILQIKKEI